eukprot:g3800.t1
MSAVSPHMVHMKGGGVYDPSKNPGADWVCSACEAINFAYRTICFRCSASRTGCMLVTQKELPKKGKAFSNEEIRNLFALALERICLDFKSSEQNSATFLRFPINLSCVNDWMKKIDARYPGRVRQISSYKSFKAVAHDMEKTGVISTCFVPGMNTYAVATYVNAPRGMYVPLSEAEKRERALMKEANANFYAEKSFTWDIQGSHAFDDFWGATMIDWSNYDDDDDDDHDDNDDDSHGHSAASTSPLPSTTTRALELMEILVHVHAERFASRMALDGLTSVRTCLQLHNEGMLKHRLYLIGMSVGVRARLINAIKSIRPELAGQTDVFSAWRNRSLAEISAGSSGKRNRLVSP